MTPQATRNHRGGPKSPSSRPSPRSSESCSRMGASQHKSRTPMRHIHSWDKIMHEPLDRSATGSPRARCPPSAARAAARRQDRCHKDPLAFTGRPSQAGRHHAVPWERQSPGRTVPRTPPADRTPQPIPRRTGRGERTHRRLRWRRVPACALRVGLVRRAPLRVPTPTAASEMTAATGFLPVVWTVAPLGLVAFIAHSPSSSSPWWLGPRRPWPGSVPPPRPAPH